VQWAKNSHDPSRRYLTFRPQRRRGRRLITRGLVLGAGETLELNSAYSGHLAFAADAGTLKLDNSATFAGTVAGMTGHDTIDFTDIDPTKARAASYSGDASGGTLTVTDGTHTANIALLGNYMASTFAPSSDGHGNTNLVDHASTDQTSLVSQPSH
jgi:hypothetical protein